MSNRGTIIGPGSFIQKGVQKFVLAVIDLDVEAPRPRLVYNGFLGHGLAIDPSRPRQAAVFEKKGPGACEVDLKAGKVLRPITTAANRQFYGHGAYSADGALLYATESVIDDGFRGVLIVRDARTLEELGELPTFGFSPHDCQLLEDGRTMVVANGGGSIHGGAMPSISYVDVQSETLIERVELVEERFNAGHFAIAAGGQVAVVSAPREGIPRPHQALGAVTLIPRGGPPARLRDPESVTERMLGEALSVVVHEPDGVVMATHPDGNLVSMWNIDDHRLVGTLESLREPRGVALTLDQELYVVSHRTETSVALTLVATSSREPVEHLITPSFTTGSHIFAHDLAAAS